MKLISRSKSMTNRLWWKEWALKIKSVSWSQATTFWLSMWTGLSMKYKMCRIVNWNPPGSNQSKSSSHTTCGIHKTLFNKKRSSTVSDTRHPSGFDYKGAWMRCKKDGDDWSSTCIKKRENYMSSKKGSNSLSKRNSLLSRNLALYN